MVWTAPMTFVDGKPLTAAQLNAQVRDNMLEVETAKASFGGGFFVAQAPHSIAWRKDRKAKISALESTTETGYTGLTTPGPLVTVQTGTAAAVFVNAQCGNSAANSVFMSVEVSGATEIEADDSRALIVPGGGDDVSQSGAFWVHTDLTPGENTFTAVYRTNAGTGDWRRRRLTVIPLD